MGSVNCRTIALAAVVSLFAATNDTSMAAYTAAPIAIDLLTCSLLPVWRRYQYIGTMANKLRAPLSATGFHGTSLMSTPAVENATAEMTMKMIPLKLELFMLRV